MHISLKRSSAALSLLAVTVLVLSACGSEKSIPSYATAAKVVCGGKQTLKASGSTAQANAMTQFIIAYQKACPGSDLTYNSNGSGAGVSEFLSGQTDFGGSDSPLAGDEYNKAKQRCGSDAWNLPVVFGPLAITYNLYKDTLVLDALDAGEDLQRHDHTMGRPGDHGAQRGDALGTNHRGIPQRRIGHHRQFPALSRCRIQRRVGQGNRQSVQRRRSAKAPRATRARRPRSETPRAQSLTTNGPSRKNSGCSPLKS